MTWAAIKTLLGWAFGGLADLFHKLIPPARLKALAVYALVAVAGWMACFIHYDVRGLKNDRVAYGKLQASFAAL